MRIRTLALGALLSLFVGTSLAQQPQGSAPRRDVPGSDVKDSAEYKRGRLLYIQCRACHDLQPNPVDKVGPHLGSLIGRPAAQVEDFAYSSALAGAKLIWDKPTLDRWLEKPSAVVPGNIMAFAGITSAADRAALIRYMEIETAKP